MNAPAELVVRASALPLAFICPGSARPPSLPVADVSTPARLGHAVHEALRSLTETGQVPWNDVHAIAERHGVSPEEVAMLCAIAQKIWPQIKASFVDALAEVAMSAELVPGLTLTGHADLLSLTGSNVGRILDWKTGRKDRNYAHQVKGYAALALAEDLKLDVVTATIVWLREKAIENYTMTRDQMRAWIGELAAHLQGWDGTYTAGVHCQHCPRSHECAAANALQRRDVAAFTDKGLAEHAAISLSMMPPDQILELNRRADMVAKMADRVKAALKAHVLEHGDVIGEGVKLTIESSDQREVDPLAAWPVLEAAGLTSAELAACMRLYITRIEGAVAKRAGRGKGAAAVRDITAKLVDADAIVTRQTQTLKERRTK